MIIRFAVCYILICALRLEAVPQEEVVTSSNSGTLMTERRIIEDGKLLYRYVRSTDEKTHIRISEGHTFYLKGKNIFTLLENEKRATERYTSADPGSVFHTVDRDTKRESVWLMDHTTETALLFVRSDTSYFKFEPKPQEPEAGE